MGESFEEVIAAERELGLRAWARAVAARLPDAELQGIDPFRLRDDIADCQANQQPTTAPARGGGAMTAPHDPTPSCAAPGCALNLAGWPHAPAECDAPPPA